MNDTTGRNQIGSMNLRHETYHVIRRKSDGRYWTATIDPEFKGLDLVGFENDPLQAARVDADGEGEMEYIAEFYEGEGEEFDRGDLEVARVHVSYAVSGPVETGG